MLRHLDIAWRAFRAVTAAMLVVLAGPVGASTYGWLQDGVELIRCRSTMQELSFVVRDMPARATAARRPVQLRLDAHRRVAQLATRYDGPQPYDAILRTVWLPKGLEVVEGPEMLIATPNVALGSASYLLTVPSHNTLFRLTEREGIVRLDEEPLL